MPMYHFRLPDGQEHASQKTPAAIRKQYPDAVITGRVEFDAAGNSILKPYSGGQSTVDDTEDAESETEAPESDESVVIEVTPVDGEANAPEAEEKARPKASRK